MSEEKRPHLVLVDGSSYLYRAFHALPDLRNRHGEPTGALYGVLNMLARLREDYKPDHVACVFDAPGPTFRHQAFPDYKAQRPAMPADLVAQIDPLHQAIRALGWPLLQESGVEADDVIATLTHQARALGWKVTISSGDKDLIQLLAEGVTLVNTLSNERLDVARATEKYGVTPTQFVDYLTLVGDTADNVPGVPKVGPKTAVKWIQQFGTLDDLMAHADEIGGVVGNHLRQSLDWLPQARFLITLDTAVQLSESPKTLVWQTPDDAALAALAERYDLRRWKNPPQTSSASPAPLPPPAPAPEARPDVHYETLLTPAQLTHWLAQLEQAELTAFDTETTGLDPLQDTLVGLSFCCDGLHAAYLPLAHRTLGTSPQLPFEETLQRLRPWLENPAAAKVGQHLKYDTHILANHGITLRGIRHDTLLQSYVLEAHQPHGLESLARRHLGRETLSYETVTGKGANAIGFEQVALDQATIYAAEDAEVTLAVHGVLYPQLCAEPRLLELYETLELPIQQVLWRMERYGVLLDAAVLTQQSAELSGQLIALESQAHLLAGQPFNLNSPKQVQTLLFETLGLPVLKKTPGGQPSTDESVLEQLALDFPLPKLLLDYRTLAKLKSTYTDALPKRINPRTGRVHTHFAQAVAVTGRLSSSDPNLQNIPIRTAAGRRIRAAFIAPPGHVLMAADYSQIELRLMAHLSGDPGLLNAFALGQDVHRSTAAELFAVAVDQVSTDQRRAAKAINFGLIYGMSAFGLARQLNLTRSAAQHYMERYFQRYPGVARYMEETRQQAREKGYVETLFGRRLFLPELRNSGTGRRQAAERAAINAPLQGTAADLIKRAMLAVQDWLDETRSQSHLILQVHDELILEVPEEEVSRLRPQLARLMEGVASLRVPLSVEVGTGKNWDEAH
ncbi:DNA polymerase I [Ferrovum sp.]|uniref:DNA polymerase I n=1 Tax=Ferrovum sp. TaxID=2609467 RepID=UPI0026170FB0|nr:DNA polymerase I [Ferrovum sp.]